MPAERVVLVGFMATGKTAVGAALAKQLGWSHIDLDAEIEREQGRTVAELFREEGEHNFRELEADATRRKIVQRNVVISTGGGWVVRHRIADLPEGTVSVWLRADPEEVLRRVRRSGGASVRPLLADPDPGDTVRRLLAERQPLYAAADLSIETDQRTIREIVREIEMMLRGRQPAPSRY